ANAVLPSFMCDSPSFFLRMRGVGGHRSASAVRRLSPHPRTLSGSGNDESNTLRPILQLAGYKPRVGMAGSAIDRSVAWTEKLLACKNCKQDLFAASR